MTSISGDVVWANGRSWQRDNEAWSEGEKEWWVNPSDNGSTTSTLRNLKSADDFMWLVRKGKLVYSYGEGFAAGIDTADSVAAHAEGYNEGYQDGYSDGVKDTTTPITTPYKVYTWTSTYPVNT